MGETMNRNIRISFETVIVGVVLVCGFAMVIAIPYELESASIYQKYTLDWVLSKGC